MEFDFIARGTAGAPGDWTLGFRCTGRPVPNPDAGIGVDSAVEHLDVDQVDMHGIAALSRDDHRVWVGPPPHPSALARSQAKCMRAHELHTRLRKRLMWSVNPTDPS
jgi:hypothetical protein